MSTKELALVTGGGTGIGRAVVQGLEAQDMEVRVASRRSGHDLTDPAAIDRLVASLPRLDLLVNNAGIAESAPVGRTTDEMWERHLALNVTAVFRLIRTALPLLQRSPNGRIVNIASTAALRGSPYIAAYAASKHALLGLSRVLAAELKNVKVHVVCPGFVDTALTARTIANVVRHTDLSPEDARLSLARQNASGRLVLPEEVAAAVVQLAHATDTGREIVIE